MMVAGERTQFSSCWAPTASRRLGILGMGALGAGAAQGGVPLSHPLCGLPGDGRALNLPGEGLGARASRDCSATSGQVSIPGEGEHRGLTYAGSRSAVGARQFSTTSASDGSSRERSSPIDPSSTAAAPLSPVSPVLRGAASLTRSCQVPTLSVGRHRSFFRVVRRSGFRLFTLWAPRRRLLPSSRGRTAVPFIVHETRERLLFTLFPVQRVSDRSAKAGDSAGACGFGLWALNLSTGIMGRGSQPRAAHAEPWRKAASILTGVSKDQWTVSLTRVYPQAL